MPRRDWLQQKSTVEVALVIVLSVGLAGCGGGLYRPVTGVPGTPPADTVTFSPAATQGWLQQYGTGYVLPGVHSLNTPSGDTAYGVATDAQGNVIVLDETLGAFPGFTTNHLPQFAVIKFDGSGNRLWTQQFGTGSGDFPTAIATDAQGNIIVGGLTAGAFPGFTNAGGGQESVVIKLNASGQMVWTQQFASSGGNSQVTALAVDPQGNVIVGGSYGTSQSTQGYVIKLAAATGATLWNQGNGAGTMNYGVSGLAADGEGNVMAVGGFPGTGSSASTTYMVAKLNGATGQTLWEQLPVTLSSDGIQNLIYTQIALDGQGNVFLGGLNDSAGYSRCAVARLANDTGSQQWQQEFGASEFCTPGGIATDTAGNVLMTGNYLHPFFPASNSSRQDDIFLAKMSGSGTGVWLQQFGSGKDGANGATSFNAMVFVATDSHNNAYVAGTTSGAFPGFTNPNGASELFVTQFGQ